MGELMRISKRGDTYEPVTGRIMDTNGPIDLTPFTLRFLGLADISGVQVVIDSDLPNHGPCVNVETVEGPGDDIQFEWPVASGNMLTIPENRGVYRYEPDTDGVASEGLYECEIEGKLISDPTKIITFPNEQAKNPGWRLDPDIA